ncbi:G5 and 3D domain-containing protein [Halalkalibacterium ligniniphilum]|uniref:G5 and 3D domain-containing protein n=1 Tax=Halalkalibacterium ligniniphilum TaxID=1134413 RepID=UPI00034BE24C|nr:G5 and 3D domain-containing protein [Halalkalibacterium ligniniphilum]
MEVNIRKLVSGPRPGKKFVISLMSLILFAAIIGYAVYETTKATVTVALEGEEEVVVQTHASTVGELMEEQAWDVQNHDLIEPALDSEIIGNMTIAWKPAKQIFVKIDGEERTVWTTANNVEELIKELEIAHTEKDYLQPSLTTAITDEMNLVYESAFQVELISDGKKREVWTTSTTVADFLEREDLELGELDRVEPELDARIDEQTDIRVIRVEKVTDVVEESVAFATVTRKDDKLESGKEKVIDSGKEGRVEKHYEVTLEDGKEVSRELVKTETVRESEDRVVAVGTRPAATNVSRSASAASSSSTPSGRTLSVTATAYTANCAGCSGITATGINLNNNRHAKVIAVDPSVIPLGTRVHVEGYGTAIAGDTGGAIRGHKIDLHMPTKAEAQRWGRRTVKITILN